MDIYTATEQAYKNGYEQGKKDINLRRYADLKERAKQLRADADEAQEKANKFFIEKQLWSPMSELKEYLGDDFSFPPFTIFYSSENYPRVRSFYVYGDICKVQEDGHMYYSDYDDGIIEWDEKQNCYVWAYCENYTNIHILGFRKERE